MKVKRFKNLWTMGLILCGAILVLIYFAKIFFPEFVVEVAQVESIARIGHYIDTHKWAWYLASWILSFICYYFYCGACCSKKIFSWKEILIISITNSIVYLSNALIPNQYTAINIISMIVLPFILKGNFKNTTICFSTLNLLQTITLEIRGLILMIASYNFATLLILMIDVYIFQVLLYFLFNFKKGEL